MHVQISSLKSHIAELRDNLRVEREERGEVEVSGASELALACVRHRAFLPLSFPDTMSTCA